MTRFVNAFALCLGIVVAMGGSYLLGQQRRCVSQPASITRVLPVSHGDYGATVTTTSPNTASALLLTGCAACGPVWATILSAKCDDGVETWVSSRTPTSENTFCLSIDAPRFRTKR